MKHCSRCCCFFFYCEPFFIKKFLSSADYSKKIYFDTNVFLYRYMLSKGLFVIALQTVNREFLPSLRHWQSSPDLAIS